MNKKYVIRNCPNLVNAYYATGKIKYGECGLKTNDELCQDVNDCFLKQIYDIASKDVVDNNFEEPLNRILFKFDISEMDK